MKKLYSEKKWRIFNTKRSERAIRKRSKRKSKVRKTNSYFYREPRKKNVSIELPIDSRLLNNTIESLDFFRKLRKQSRSKVSYVKLDLSKVQKLDYSFISILTAVSEELRRRNLRIRGNYPKANGAKQYFEASGFLNRMYTPDGKRLQGKGQSDELHFEYGIKKLTNEDLVKISNISKNINLHLTGINKYYQSVKNIILELCGNAIEWSDSRNQQWTLGVKYDSEKVIFTVTDLGIGILKSLHRRFHQKAWDVTNSNDEILVKAFEGRYGSKSLENNRNQGLPYLKNEFNNRRISNLMVITNDVFLDFGNPKSSRTFTASEPKFRGTFYRWEVTKENIGSQ